MMFSNGRKLNKNIRKVVNVIKESITATDDDGFGWLGVDKDKKQFGERSTDPELFHSMFGIKNFRNIMRGMPNTQKHYGYFGDITNSEVDGPLLFHGRTSTNDKNMRNTHPIARGGWSVIHNGVVTNQGKKYKKNTTNDTEDIAHYLSTEGIQGMTKNLSGYYAVGAVDPSGNLHVIKDSIASLVCSYIPKLESYVFATTDDLISDFCTMFKLAYEPVNKVMDDTYIVMDKDNKIITFQEIKSMGMYSSYERDLMDTSLHYMNGRYQGAEEYKWSDKDKEDKTPNLPSIDNIGNIIDLKTALPGANTTTTKEEILDSLASNPVGASDYLREMEEYAEFYTIYDRFDRQIDIDTFRALSVTEKLECEIVDPVSGSPVSPSGYNSFTHYRD